MTDREEIDNLLTEFEEMGFCPAPFNHNAVVYAGQWRDKIRNVIINHEQDILKEFVEWYKKVLIKDYDDKANFVSVNLERNNDKDFWYFTGQCTAIQRLIALLDRDLEKFLEENDNADR